MTNRLARVPLRLAVACLTLAVSACARAEGNASLPASAGVAPGPAARELLGARGFDWRTVETEHFRVHTPARMSVETRAMALGDSAEAARAAVLRLLEEPMEATGEPKAEIFFVDTREDMTRLVRMPIGGFAQPGELTAVFVAGPGYRPFLRHELGHAYASARWGELKAGDWLTEGIGALAQGDCQGHTIDELASGFAQSGSIPPLRILSENFRAYAELPSYLAAASVLDFVRRRDGMAKVRALWSAPRSGTHPLGDGGERVEKEWREYLASVPPAEFDTVRLKRAGC